MTDKAPTLPPHVEDTVQTIAAVHVGHYRQAAPLQRIVGRITATAGRPGLLVILTIIVLMWVSVNLAVWWSGRAAWDPPPFSWLVGAASLAGLYMTGLILVTQRHDDELARRREQLTLEIAILSEQKAAKIIRILEEMRRDSPHLSDRADPEAQIMSDSADPQALLELLKKAHEGPLLGGIGGQA